MSKGNILDLVIQNGSLMYGTRYFHVHICIKNGKIAQLIDSGVSIPETKELFDASGMYVFPGFIDPHVHFALNLGKYTSNDDFRTGSIAAAFGGMTTVMDFTDVVTGGEEELNLLVEKRKEMKKDALINVGLHLTVANPEISPEKLVELTLRHKLRSIKVFTTYSSSGRVTNDGYIFDLFKAAKGTGIVIMIHAENDQIIEHNIKRYSKKGNITSADLPNLRPVITEIEAVNRVCRFAVETDGRLYIAHISSGKTIQMLQKDFGEYLGKNIFTESCPHYFYFNDTFLKGDQAHLYTTCPPLRSEAERLLMRDFLKKGEIYSMGSDHCSFFKALKEQYKNDFLNMPNGIPGVEMSFSLMYNIIMLEQNPISLAKLVSMYSANPAKIFGFYPYRGTLIPGAEADITIFNPQSLWLVNPETLHMKVDYTPYDGLKLRGKVDSTICGGNFVIKHGELFEQESAEDERPV